MQYLVDAALQTKLKYLDNKVHLRGLIEYTNKCEKNCMYCGIRSSNRDVVRYTVTDDEVLACAKMAYSMGFGSVAIQTGECTNDAFTEKISYFVREIKKLSNNQLGITLSCGEQPHEVYQQWFEAGAHRYLLRIEASDEDLYYKIHPHNAKHDFRRRVESIKDLIAVGYQTGTGVMIGLPFQTLDNLVDDLLLFKNLDVAMIGMGPFIPHPQTPLWKYRDMIPGATERMNMTLKMIAVARLMMPEINMVATTANQTIDAYGREKAILAGANVIMPNLTPNIYREEYLIYPDKANVHDKPEESGVSLEMSIKAINHEIDYNHWGDSVAFTKKQK